jgi:hypothetical protein
VCEEIKAKEDKIALLVLSAGIMTMKGRDGTAFISALLALTDLAQKQPKA